MSCLASADPSLIWNAVEKDQVPHCPLCDGIIRPNVTFFGESLPKTFHEHSLRDLKEADLLIVIGTSLKVYPFAALVNDVSPTTPRLLFNLEEAGPFQGISEASDEARVSGKYYRDVAFLGQCDAGVEKLAELLGWQHDSASSSS